MNPPMEVGLLLYPGVQMSAVLGLTDLLYFANRLNCERLGLKQPVMRVSHLQQLGSQQTQRIFDTMPGTAGEPTFIVMGPCLVNPDIRGFGENTINWLRDRHADGAKLASVCGGAFLLAQTGVAHTRLVTTHFSLVDELAGRFPDLNIDANRILIDNGDVITAGGFMAWIDLGLHLVDRILGPVAMVDTADFMLIEPPGREQRYFKIFSPQLEHGDEAVLRTQLWMEHVGTRGITNSAMAKRAGLEERTFLRRFRKATGLKPQEYCRHLRVAKARELMSGSRRPIESVAWEVGYTDLGSFRRSFFKLTGLNPADYRRRFGGG